MIAPTAEEIPRHPRAGPAQGAGATIPTGAPPASGGGDGARRASSFRGIQGCTQMPGSLPREIPAGPPWGKQHLGKEGPGQCSERFADEGVTTIMVLNIPNHIAMKDFVDKLKESRLKDTFNFCNIPRDLPTGKNMGFAFVNFDTAANARMFSKEWAGKEMFGKGKKLKLKTAYIQGITANVCLAQKSMNRKNKSFKPLLVF